jgi:uncharacterized RDD family membrane protein YckC
MKCPKCQYLSFEPEPRCRNCGYDLATPGPDLALHAEPAGTPLGDLTLRSFDSGSLAGGAPRPADRVPLARGREAGGLTGSLALDLDSHAPEPEPVRARGLAEAAAPPAVPRAAAASESAPAPGRRAPTTELPLFVKDRAAAPREEARDAEPRVTVPPPRPPLAVQRRSTDPPRARKLGPFDRDLLEDLQRIERIEREHARQQAGGPAVDPQAGTAPRLIAALLDAVILAAIALLIVWFTLRWCGLDVEQAASLPALPLAAFLLLVVSGYLMLFTAAGGQTIGKMASGIRVVPGEGTVPGGGSLTLGQAALRAVVAIPSVLAFGAGFVPGLLGDHRALHDRIAHTRVVRA